MTKFNAEAKGSRRRVMHGTAKATAGGLKKRDLLKNKNGRIVSKRRHYAGKENKWILASNIASDELGIYGMNRIKQMRLGSAYYNATRLHFKRLKHEYAAMERDNGAEKTPLLTS